MLEDDVKMHQIFVTANLDFITVVQINLLLPHYCSILKIAGVLAGIEFSIRFTKIDSPAVYGYNLTFTVFKQVPYFKHESSKKHHDICY